MRYAISGGNAGAVINDDVGVDAINDAEIEEEEEGETEPASLALSHSHGIDMFVLVLDLDLEGVGFGNSCCLREMFLDLVSVSSAWGGSSGLFLGPARLSGANSPTGPEAETNLDEADERLGEVAGVMAQLAVVVFVAEDAQEE